MGNAVTREARALAAAFAFLTRIPIAKRMTFADRDLRCSVAYFPLVGIFVGAFAALVLALSMQVWSSLVSVVLSLGATVLLTGAFHEDALADTLDGFGGGWTREQVLEIMRDSRVGSYALVGVVLVILAKVAALNDIATGQSLRGAAATLITAHTLGRWSSVLLMRVHAYARLADGQAGTGTPFIAATNVVHFAVATIVAVAAPIIALSYVGGIAIAVTVFITLLAGRYYVHRIGGYTGDTLGATNQIVELAVYLLVAAVR